MANLLNLPNEILIAILEILATVDLQSLIASQLTNRRLHALVQDAINKVQNLTSFNCDDGAVETRIHPLWRTNFKALFNTVDCFTMEEKRRMAYLSLNGDFTLPFRRLPWAKSGNKRKAYLRPEASWRDISLTFGRAPITHLDVVKSYSAPEGDSVDYYQVELPPSGMTMGLFYDVLLSQKATYRRETGSWELIVGRRLRSYDLLSEYECFIPDDRELVDWGEEARQAAVLYVRGGPVSRNATSDEDEDDDWIGSSQNKQRLLPWQGPIQNFIFTGYFNYM
ncbi:hypothetical protein F5Y13DRAFT_153626 [Hypoxylon sp. FL1857]|nr:hypothetical protein F5Y13DRAFT_153626 [Hypoxylon sp. FL1857]